MPALRVQRLREEAQQLLEHWNRSPQAFLRELEDRWRAWGVVAGPGKHIVGPPTARWRFYRVPPVALHVLLQTWRNLAPRERLREMAEALWQHPVVESRLMAVRIWAGDPREADLPCYFRSLTESRAVAPVREALLREWGPVLARTFPQAYLEAWQRHMVEADAADRQAAVLLAVLPAVEDLRMDLFPRIRPVLEAHLQPPDPALLPEWREVLAALFRRWPGEVLPWMRHLARRTGVREWRWLLARLLPLAEPRWKPRLRALLRELPETP